MEGVDDALNLPRPVSPRSVLTVRVEIRSVFWLLVYLSWLIRDQQRVLVDIGCVLVYSFQQMRQDNRVWMPGIGAVPCLERLRSHSPDNDLHIVVANGLKRLVISSNSSAQLRCELAPVMFAMKDVMTMQFSSRWKLGEVLCQLCDDRVKCSA